MNKYHNTYESCAILYKDEISQDQLISIEFDLNSNIARLDKRLGSVKGAKDSIQRKINYHQRENGSYIGSTEAYNNNQEVLGNQLQELSTKLNEFDVAEEMLEQEVKARKDFFKNILGKEYVPFRSAKPEDVKKSFQRKTNNLQNANKWWAKNGHKVEPVVKIGDTLPLEFAENYK